MDKLIATGGGPLKGRIRISGAKNAALPLMIASLLTDDTLRISNIPHLHDITTTMELLGRMGADLLLDERMEIHANCANIREFTAPHELVRTMRASILVLGPSTTLYGPAPCAIPGAAPNGPRPSTIPSSGSVRRGGE
ncbi:MAG: UDP-N-acetylglucosamine 1-carboxyvinyltransferase, partial [Gammaproteobacteria bacterium]|nr:UDP-N-acetylglucosamine 1-carboxyvinyltransferase [Gammaproteobacteria bacterium]